MATVKIDNKDYDFDQLSADARGTLGMLQFVDAEIGRLNRQLAVLQTSRTAYAKALNEALAAGEAAL